MRQIKFRVWDNQKNAWATDNDVRESIGLEFGVGDYFINSAGEKMARWSFMQFTGLCDRNGKEICESDLITMTSYNYQHLNNLVWEVVYVPDAMQFKFYCNRCNGREMYKEVVGWHNFEVIGNIHDNPELIHA